MPSIEERVAYLEGKAEEHASALTGWHSAIADVRAAVQVLADRVDARFAQMEGRFGSLDQKIDRQFMWLVGIQMTALTAVIAALIAVSYR